MSSLDEFKSRKVRIFRNGDVHHPGKKFVVSTRIFRNFEQFLLRVSEDLSLVNGAVRRIHTLQGTPVRDLEELEDNGFYVATAGEMFRRSVYPVAGEETERKAMVGRGRRHVAGAAYEAEEGEGEKEREEKLFGPSTKAYRVIVFANGETSNPGIKLVLNHRNCKSFEQLLNVLSNLLRLKTGFVRKLYDAENGRRIQALRDLKDGQNLVAGTWETFRRVKYPLLNPNMTQFDVKKEDDTPRPVTFYPNGDSYHHGFTITLRKSRFHSLRKLIDHLNASTDLPSGRITRIYTMDGKRIEEIDDLIAAASASPTSTQPPVTEEEPSPASEEPHQDPPHIAQRSFVIGCGEDPFYNVPYDLNRVRSRHGPIGLGGTTTRNEYLGKIRGVAAPRRARREEGGEGGLKRLPPDEEGEGKEPAPPRPVQQRRYPSEPPKSRKPISKARKPEPEPQPTSTPKKTPATKTPSSKNPNHPLTRQQSHQPPPAVEIEEDEIIRDAHVDTSNETYGASDVQEFQPRGSRAMRDDDGEEEVQEHLVVHNPVTARASKAARTPAPATPPPAASSVDDEESQEDIDAERFENDAAGYTSPLPPHHDASEAEDETEDEASNVDEEEEARAIHVPEAVEEGEEEEEEEEEEEPEPEKVLSKKGSQSSIPMLKSRSVSKGSGLALSKQGSRNQLPDLPSKEV